MSGEFALDFSIDNPDGPTVLTAAVLGPEDGRPLPVVMLRVTGMEESEHGARMTADMLRDWADAIEARLPLPPRTEAGSLDGANRRVGKMSPAGIAEFERLSALRRPGETVLDAERRERRGNPHNPSPSIETYKTPERVLKNREKRAERKRFNPRKAD